MTRYWRVGLVLIVVLVMAYLAVDQVLLAQLAARRKAIKAQGGRLSLSEFALNLPDSENAAVVYARAYETSEMLDDLEWEVCQDYVLRESAKLCACGADIPETVDEDLPQLTPAQTEALVEECLEQNAATFQALEQALSISAYQYNRYEGSPEEIAEKSIEGLLTHMSNMRTLVRLVAVRANWEILQGKPTEACHWVAVGLRLSNGLYQEPLLITGLVASACQGVVLEPLKTVLCTGPLPDPLPEELTAELSVAADRFKLDRIYEGERCFGMDSAEGVKTWCRPINTLDLIGLLDQSEETISVVREPDDIRHAELAAALCEERLEPESGIHMLLHPRKLLENIYRSSSGMGLVGLHCSIGAARRAQVAVALKQYKQDHGAFPDSLKQLPNLPVDPATGKSFAYRRDGNGFILEDERSPWCVLE